MITQLTVRSVIWSIAPALTTEVSLGAGARAMRVHFSDNSLARHVTFFFFFFLYLHLVLAFHYDDETIPK